MNNGDLIIKKQNALPGNPESSLVNPLGSFNLQTNRITSRNETYLKIKGSFKVVVENRGDVDATIFGNFPLPSYAKEVFETGDTSLGFFDHSSIEYAPESPGENINILLTAYFKVK